MPWAKTAQESANPADLREIRHKNGFKTTINKKNEEVITSKHKKIKYLTILTQKDLI